MPSFTTDPTTMQLDTMTGPQKRLLATFSNLLGGQAGKGVPTYGGKLTPGMTDMMTTAGDYWKDLMAGGSPYQMTNMDTFSRMSQPFDPAAATDYWNKAVALPGRQEFQDQILPQVMEQFAGMDAMDSGGARYAMRDAATKFGLGEQATLAKILMDEKARTEGRNMQAMEFGGKYPIQLGAAMLDPAKMEYGAESDTLSAEMKNWLYGRPENNPYLQLMPSLLGAKSFENVVIPGSSSNPWASLGGSGLMSGSSLMGSILAFM